MNTVLVWNNSVHFFSILPSLLPWLPVFMTNILPRSVTLTAVRTAKPQLFPCEPVLTSKTAVGSQADKQIYTTQVVRVALAADCLSFSRPPPHPPVNPEPHQSPAIRSAHTLCHTKFYTTSWDILTRSSLQNAGQAATSSSCLCCKDLHTTTLQREKKQRKVPFCSKYTLLLQTKLHRGRKTQLYVTIQTRNNKWQRHIHIEEKKKLHGRMCTHINTNWACCIDIIVLVSCHWLTYTDISKPFQFTEPC